MNFIYQTATPEENNCSWQLQKYRQQTQYVCLKLCIKNWQTFLTQIRKGNIIIKPTSSVSNSTLASKTNKTQQTIQMMQLPFPSKQKLNSFDTMFYDILQNMSTKRQTGKQRIIQHQSPIYNQATIRSIRGDDTNRSQQNSASFTVQHQTSVAAFQNIKIQDILSHNSSNHMLIQDVLNKMEKQNGQKQLQSLQGFQTFRKNSQHECYSVESQRRVEEEQYGQNTVKKEGYCYPLMELDTLSQQDLSRIASQEWIKQSIDQQKTCGMKEFLLALQNTKLRRQIKLLSRMFKKTSQRQQLS